MLGLLGKTSVFAQQARKTRRAPMTVEGLEGRELLAANFTLADTLNARDVINLYELNVVQSIETSRLNETAQFQQVIANGNARSVGLYNAYLTLVASEKTATPDQLPAIRQAEKNTLLSIQAVRGLMRQATVVDSVTQQTLQQNYNQVVATFNNTQNNLSRGNNPFLTVPHAENALAALGRAAAQHAASAEAKLATINNQILGPLFIGVPAQA